LEESLSSMSGQSVCGVAVPVAVVAILICLLYFLLRSCAGQTMQSARSPDGEITAKVEVFNFHSATDTNTVSVVLRKRFSPFSAGVFGGLNYGARIKVHWMNSRNLRITCERCDKLDYRGSTMRREWNGIMIDYDIQNWFNPQEKQSDH